jgi:predicted HicB family RNase H-like nuclease
MQLPAEAGAGPASIVTGDRERSTVGTVTYKGYVANVDFDAETASLVGRVVNSREPLDFRSASATSLLDEFHALIDRYLDDCEAQGLSPAKPYSGKLLVRIDPAMHAAVATDAARLGWSINRWVEFAIGRTLDDSPDREHYDFD